MRVGAQRINIYMRVDELLTEESDLVDWQASRSLCKSSKPNSALGASALASCKSQGYRRRSHKRKFKVAANKPRQSVKGRKIKGAAYGGPLPDYD